MMVYELFVLFHNSCVSSWSCLVSLTYLLQKNALHGRICPTDQLKTFTQKSLSFYAKALSHLSKPLKSLSSDIVLNKLFAFDVFKEFITQFEDPFQSVLFQVP